MIFSTNQAKYNWRERGLVKKTIGHLLKTYKGTFPGTQVHYFDQEDYAFLLNEQSLFAVGNFPNIEKNLHSSICRCVPKSIPVPLSLSLAQFPRQNNSQVDTYLQRELAQFRKIHDIHPHICTMKNDGIELILYNSPEFGVRIRTVDKLSESFALALIQKYAQTTPQVRIEL